MTTEPLRLFFAVPAPAAVRADLARALGRLHRDWRPVQPHQMHLTLAFLGAVPADRLAVVLAAGQQAAARVGPFPLRLGDTDCFPNQQQPRVLYVQVAAPPLLRLASDLQAALAEWADAKPFRPHLTLARQRAAGRPPHHAMRFDHAWTVESFDLIRSDLGHGRAEHTVLQTFRLTGPAPAPAD
ncbi:MAG: 2'-5' RNA ligase [Candidatus Ozemobacter sibiricus]|jgi:2'-5' RNA ligase|uniref:RNA 2',3'-cyclic phosphodiesterase n=1 Tax=Candidatus Ozemobacter sibiricus TaxID=2268124 RepID=A0A367ZSL3_9BACT|nr:MAG: 2'-5' RNA ligase [Candidatus Ozemobacter sibiricus]